jgi:D-sedoheptulose 7-phosphate isomerase
MANLNGLEVWKSSLTEAQQMLETFITTPENLARCERFSQMLTETIRNGGNVFSCGNGGSHCDAMHFAEEMTGRYRKNRRALGALALGDASHVTCSANDYGFDTIFARQVEGLGRKGDLLICMSTSGNSQNILNALEMARSKGLRTVALLGKGGGKAKDLADLAIVVPGQTADRIQEIHIKLLHIVIEAMEREIFPENYA